jgi:allantoicase
MSALPRHVDRRTGADLVTRFYFPIKFRTLEAWPLVWRRVNGKAVTTTAELFARAEAMMQAAPAIRGGRRAAKEAA